MKRTMVVAGLCVVSLLACKRENAAAPVSAPAPVVAAPETAAADSVQGAMADFRTTTLDGKPWALADQRDKWVVVNFWATWCGPCLEEMPELSALHGMRDGIEVIGLAYEDNTPEAMKAFMTKHPVTYPIALIDVYKPITGFDAPVGLPVTHVIDPQGKLAKTFTGPVTAKMIEDVVAAAGGKVG